MGRSRKPLPKKFSSPPRQSEPVPTSKPSTCSQLAHLCLQSTETTSRVRSALAAIPDVDPKKINSRYLERITEAAMTHETPAHPNLDMVLKHDKIVIQKIDSLDDPFATNDSFHSSEEDESDEGRSFSPLSYSLSPKPVTQHNDIFSDDFVQPRVDTSMDFFKHNAIDCHPQSAKSHLGYDEHEDEDEDNGHLDLTLAWLDQIYEDGGDLAETEPPKKTNSETDNEDENRSPRLDDDERPAHVGKKRRYVADNIMREVEIRFPLRELRLEEWSSDKSEAPPKKKAVRWSTTTTTTASTSTSRSPESSPLLPTEASSSTPRPASKVRFLRMLSPKAKPSVKGKEREEKS
ncbi:hypothetical protein DFQ28_002441 [Apophysomyces sp. BC1034]|nr:hypothetical protein DFQ30_000490 [Apophysomyces sp. BC1015]KAG0176540.1 hypothetical protein DFQ29_005991 [Apophysomyces sp. BC1021]KAG0190161.1 hypothetical protein DFQ28_002441 [Apophysomyces sp. BC1034]